MLFRIVMNQMSQWSKTRVSSVENQRGVAERVQQSVATPHDTQQQCAELWRGWCTFVCVCARLRFPLLPPE